MGSGIGSGIGPGLGTILGALIGAIIGIAGTIYVDNYINEKCKSKERAEFENLLKSSKNVLRLHHLAEEKID